MNIKSLVLVSSLFLLSFWGLPALAQQHANEGKSIVISAINNEGTHELAKEVVRAVYRKNGIAVEFDDLPARRALEWANAGKTDGDLARIDGTEKVFTNLIKISPPVIEFKGVVFTKKIERDIQSWNDLKGLSVGIIAGIRYSDIGTKGLDPIKAKDMTRLFKLLDSNHIDVAIAVLDAGKMEIQRNFKESKIHIIGQPLFSAPLYHYIHFKNRDLVPRLESTLQEMVKSGEVESIREKLMQEILHK